MEKAKLIRAVEVVLLLIMLLSFCACASTSVVEAKEESAVIIKEEEEITLVAQIDKQLEGTWVTPTQSTAQGPYYDRYTFHNGNYVAEWYLNGELQKNPTIGTYVIGTEAIYTVTIDQDNIVEGDIPFTFDNGTLELHGKSGELTKEG